VTTAHSRAGHGPPSKAAGRLLWGGIAASLLLGTVGAILTPRLSTTHPLAMLWLEAADRNLLLARHVSLLPYVIAGSLRRLVSDPLFYLAGHWYGDSALRRLEPHLGRRTVRVGERLFHRGAYPMLIAFTGRVVSTLAGITGMSVPAFAIIAVVRTIAVVLMFHWLGGVFGTQIDAVLHVFNAYVIPSTAAIALVVLGSAFISQRRERRMVSEAAATLVTEQSEEGGLGAGWPDADGETAPELP
jgi:membrane protein DedA with SNARE-associated domain